MCCSFLPPEGTSVNEHITLGIRHCDISRATGYTATQQRRYEWQRSLATQSEYMVDSVITHASVLVMFVVFLFIVSLFIVHSYVCILSSGYTTLG